MFGYAETYIISLLIDKKKAIGICAIAAILNRTAEPGYLKGNR